VEEIDDDNEDEDDSEWDSEDEDVEDDDVHQTAQQKSGKPNVAAANSRPRKQDIEWLPPRTLPVCGQCVSCVSCVCVCVCVC
jgi:hypothetical protein